MEPPPKVPGGDAPTPADDKGGVGPEYLGMYGDEERTRFRRVCTSAKLTRPSKEKKVFFAGLPPEALDYVEPGKGFIRVR